MLPIRQRPGFDRVASLYPLLERLVYAHRLSAARHAFLPALSRRANCLLLGEGNGRFLRRLLEQSPHTTATVVEISPRMIDCAQKSLPPSCRQRVNWLEASALDIRLPVESFDAVITHYFFDLFPPAGQRQILQNTLPALKLGGVWQDSEFLSGGNTVVTALRNRARLALAYRFLGLLCDFPARTLHCPGTLFQAHGLTLKSETTHHGQTTARLWQK